MKTTGFWGWYNRQCGRRYVGLLMIPTTILVLFLPMFTFCWVQELWLNHEQSVLQQLDKQRALIYAKGDDPDNPSPSPPP
jgi:hypothetical protein